MLGLISLFTMTSHFGIQPSIANVPSLHTTDLIRKVSGKPQVLQPWDESEHNFSLLYINIM